ncbi:hypothetical protein EC12741_2352 [Escherichia coli 1.2741]|nr:hypothetical protein EC12741_2352 [Escherichia coli 1.2741]
MIIMPEMEQTDWSAEQKSRRHIVQLQPVASVRHSTDKNGQYRYMGNNGPMQLEVPRDQYAGAVETMRNKIREGKVPGVTDPAEASRLIRRGHLTYTQARNITRFGTIESVTYDIAEGSVVSLAAGGISFALTASVFWLSTGDRDAALQTAAVQAGKTFTRTLAVYVTTQQLHRLSVVQGMLKHIDFSTASPTVRLALQKGTGAGNISALNKVMKGTLVTSLALVAVATGPDMIKMLRGRISGTQFIRNLAVASSGVAGGAVESVRRNTVQSTGTIWCTDRACGWRCSGGNDCLRCIRKNCRSAG